MYLATAGTREQESKTRVRKGLHRSARWDGEIISFIYGDPSPSVEGIVAEASAAICPPGHDVHCSPVVVHSYYHFILSEVNLRCTPALLSISIGIPRGSLDIRFSLPRYPLANES